MDSKYTLLLGFSYSLQPDGSPGSYNRQIAEDIRTWLSLNSGTLGRVRLAAQWEIVDALGSDYEGPDPFPAPPPLFNENDFPDGRVDEFLRVLRQGETAAARELAIALSDVLAEVGYEDHADDGKTIFDQASLNAARLSIYLNHLLDEPQFYKRFRSDVSIPRQSRGL